MTTVLPAEPSGEGNAADDYKKAVDLVKPICDRGIRDDVDHPKFGDLDKLNEDLASWEPQQSDSDPKPTCKPIEESHLTFVKQVCNCACRASTKNP